MRRAVTPAASAASTTTSARDSTRTTAGRRPLRDRSATPMPTSSTASIAGTTQLAPRLNLAGSSSGITSARTSAPASGQRFSVPIPVRTTSTFDMGLRGALICLWAHQSRAMLSVCTVAGTRSAASASAIKARAASSVAATSRLLPSAGTLTTIQARSGCAWACAGTPVARASR
jgi:hypothetical protein